MNGNRKRVIEEEEDDGAEYQHDLQRRRVDRRPTQESSGSTPVSSQNYTSVPPAKVYMEGSIVRVKLKNFVTYTELEFIPGPRLNVIIGPNGSGKSSIICALALGLGGAPALLGRAKQVSHFIKHGKESAEIEIELFVKEGNIVIKRHIFKDNSSDYFVNRKKVTAAILHETIRKLRIQVDNLCQFLPQDKVVSFAAMTPTELLLETEKAIGMHDLYNNHMKLIETKKELLQKQTKFSGHEGILDDLKKQNESLEKEVERFKQRKEYLQKVDDFKKKRLWVLVDIAGVELNESLAEKNKVDAKVKELEKERSPLLKVGETLKNNIAKLDAESSKHSGDIKKAEQEALKKSGAIEKYNETLDNIHNEMDSLQKRAEERLAEVAKCKQIQQQINTQIANLPNEEATRAKIDEKNKMMKETNVQQGQIKTDIANAKNYVETLNMELSQVNQALDALNNIGAMKIEALKRNAKTVFDAFQNIKNRLKDKFSKYVYGPICFEMNVQNPEHAKYLENAIHWNILTAFVCQSKQDRELFYRELDAQNIRGINLLYLPELNSSWSREYRIEDLRPFGVECFLDQTFEADKLIKDVLVNNVPLQNIAAGTRSSIGREEELHSKTGIKGFYTPAKSYQYSQSRYGDKNKIIRINALKESKLLFQGVNLQEKNNLNNKKQDIEAKLNEARLALAKLQGQEQEFSKQIKILHEERQMLQSTFEERKKLYSKLNMLTRKIDDMSREENTDQIKVGYQKQIKSAHFHRVNNLRDSTNLLIQIGRSMVQRDLVTLKKSKAEAQYKIDCYALENLNRQISDQKMVLKMAVDRLNDANRKLKAAEATANKEAPLDEELEELFKILPEELDVIDEEIENYTEKARQIGNTDSKVMHDYEQRQKEIQSLANQITNHKSDLEEVQKKMEDLKNDWIIPVREFIAEINEKFTQFFKEIRCMGEVLLGYDEKDPDNFEKYSIDIKVRFRDEDQLQSLTAHLQSGGERSVATMLFLISLQGLTNCPFRAVDEINQGMDPKNERMIFDQIVKSANKPGRPQYFLITPKLLHDLEYSKNTTVLCVYTGPWHVNQSEWDTSLKEAVEAKSKKTV